MPKSVYPSGTAFPIMHAGGIFLITAAHCIQPRKNETLHCFYNGARCNLAEDSCEIIVNQELDVAAIFLNDDRFVRLLGAINALPVEDERIFFEPQLLRIFGFPNSKNKGIGDDGFIPKGVSLSVPLGSDPRLKSDIPEHHRVGLSMDPKTFVDDDGARSFHFQKIYGMSGGPLLKFADRGGGVGGRVCGVFVEWDTNTRIGTAVRYSSVVNWLSTEIG